MGRERRAGVAFEQLRLAARPAGPLPLPLAAVATFTAASALWAPPPPRPPVPWDSAGVVPLDSEETTRPRGRNPCVEMRLCPCVLDARRRLDLSWGVATEPARAPCLGGVSPRTVEM